MTTRWTTALLAATAMSTTVAVPANAQAAGASAAATVDDTAARLDALKAQVDALQKQLDAVKKSDAVNTPTFKAAPEFSSGASGYKFKLQGELQFDAAQVDNPHNRLSSANLGFSARSRRFLFGAAGSLPGDFTYNFTFNLAEGVVDYEDMIIEYAPHKSPLTLTAGYFYPFSSMENMMSNKFTSFVERAQLNDATSNGRRLGVAVTYVDKANDFRIQTGLFNEGINGNPNPGNAATPANQNLFDRTGYQFSARTVFSPVVENTQLHFGANFQYRRFRTDARGLNYRVRPFSFTTDQRFAATGNIAAKGDEIYGIEALAIHGPLHFQGEAQYIHMNGYRPGQTVGAPQALLGTAYPQNAHFITGYGEVGYWLTGETRGYKNGKVDRTKILHPLSAYGMGGLQLVGRVDYIDLTQQVGNTAPGSFGLINGGKQVGYLAALNYWPIDYVRFSAEYARAQIEGGPFAAIVLPASPDAIPNRSYGTNTFALRAQVDF